MKRALIVLLLLALVAGGLFAQLTIGGHVRSGVEVAIDEDTTFSNYHTDVAGGYRYELNGSYANADGNARANFRIAQNAAGTLGGVDAAYVTLKPADNFYLYGGKVDANNYGTMGSVDANGGVGGVTGISLRFDPIPALSLGAGVQPVSGGEFGDASYRFGVKFTQSGLLAAAANLNYDGAGNDGDGSVAVAAGVDILALAGAGLTKLAVDISAGNVTKLDTAGSVTVGPRVHFSVAGISGGVRANVYIPVRDGQDLDAAAAAWASMPIPGVTGVTAGLGVGYELNGVLKASNDNFTFDPRYWDALPRAISSEDESVLVIRPTVDFAIGSGTLGVGYGFLTQLGGESKSKSALTLTFNVGF